MMIYHSGSFWSYYVYTRPPQEYDALRGSQEACISITDGCQRVSEGAKHIACWEGNLKVS